MPTKIRTQGILFDNGEQQNTSPGDPPIWAGTTNDNNVRNSYNNFPIGTKVAHRDTRYRNTGWTGNGTGTLRDDWRRVWEKTGNNSWNELGG